MNILGFAELEEREKTPLLTGTELRLTGFMQLASTMKSTMMAGLDVVGSVMFC